jgi:signal peptidase
LERTVRLPIELGIPSSRGGHAEGVAVAGSARRLRRTRAVVANAALLLVAAAAALMLVPSLFGYERYVITSGSMSGTIDRGSLVFAKAVPVDELRRGDVITYTPPGRADGGRVTHRIAWAGRDRHGRHTFRTKGDANRAVDPWTFVLDRPAQARHAFHVPYLGYAFAALGMRHVRMLLLALPAALIALALIASLWREAGEEARRARLEPARR